MIASTPSIKNTFITDEDNPLIDRKYPNDIADDALILPQIYRFDFTKMPDFSQTVMQIQPTKQTLDSRAQIVETNTAYDDTYLDNASLTTKASAPIIKSNQVSQSLNSKINSKSLSRRQAIAQAKAQAKQIEHQKQLEEEQRQAEEAARYKAEVEAALLNPKIHEGLLNQRKSIAESQAVVKQHAIFGELAQDLQTIQLPDSNFNEQAKQIYEKAVGLIQAAESNEDISADNLAKAVQVIKKFAEDGVADALLRQALWLFEGNRLLNISQDPNEALTLLQQAASQNDNRAQKLLSKLYYAGHFIEQDSDMGKYWLELAAAHGHPEAIRITQGIATMGVLKQTQREETSYIKKLGLGIVVLIILMVLIVVLVKT